MLIVWAAASVELLAWSSAGVAIGFYGIEHWVWPIWALVVTSLLGLVIAFLRIWLVAKKFE